MASLGELSLDVKAKTDGFLTKMKGVATSASKAQVAIAGIAAGAAVAGTAIAALGSAALGVVKDIASTGDASAKAAQQIGISAEAYQELGHAMELSGEDIGTLGKGLLRLSKNMQDVTEGVKAPREAFDKLGISVTDQAGNLLNMEQILPGLADRFATMANGPQKAAIAMEIFGKSGAQMIPFLNAGSKGIAEMREEARELGLVMSNDAAATSERFNDTLDRLNKAFGGVKTTIGVALLPAFTELFNIILTVTKSIMKSVPIADYMKQGLGLLTQGALSLVRGLAEIAPIISVMGSAIGVAINLGQIWIEGFFALNKVVVGVGATIAEFITGALSGFIGAGADLAAAVGMDGMAGALKTAEKGIASVAGAMGSVGSAAFDSLGDSVDNVAGHMGDVDDILSDLASGSTTSALRDTLASIEEGISNVGTASLDSAKEFESGADLMASAAKKVELSMKDMEDAVASAFEVALKQAEAWQARLDAFESDKTKIATKGAAMRAKDDETKKRLEQKKRDIELSGGGNGAAEATNALGKLAQGSEAASIGFEAMTGSVGGVVGIFAKMWASAEGIQKSLAMLQTLFDETFGAVINDVASDIASIVEPLFDAFRGLAPVMKAVIKVMNPFFLVIKAVGAVMKALAKPFKDLGEWLRRLWKGIKVALHNMIPTNKKWEVDEFGNIVERKSGDLVDEGRVVINDDSVISNQEADRREAELQDEQKEIQAEEKRLLAEEKARIEALGQAGKDLAAMGRAFSEVFNSPMFDLGMGSGSVEVWDHFHRAASSVDELTESAREASQSLSNVPSIFRANLRRGQAGMASGGGGVSTGGGAGGDVYISGNVIIQGANLDETLKNIRRRQFTAYGETYTGLAAVSALPASG